MKFLKSHNISSNKTARATQAKLGQRRRRLGILTALITAVLFLFALQVSVNPTVVNAQAPTPTIDAKDLIQRAWERAKESGSYGFDADITQAQRPLASATNVGKSIIRDNFYLEGVTNLADQTLEMTLWAQSGTVLDKNTGAQIRIEGDKAYARQGDQPWQEVNNFTGLFAPNNDFMAYLVAAINVQNRGLDSRAGIEFTRITFDIDGLAYAEYMRDQIQADMIRRGELLQGMEVTLPSIYKDMSGQGELWLDADGLPLRQLLQLEFAPEDDQQISAEISVNFRDFAPIVVAALPNDSAVATILTQLTPILPGTVTPAGIITSANHFVTNSLPILIIFVLVILFVGTLLFVKRSRKVLTALQLTLIIAMLTGPLLQSVTAQQISSRQQARAAASEARSQESDMSAALNGSLEKGTAVANPGTVQDILNDSGLDSDNDGYTDVAEKFLGTNPKTNSTLNNRLPSLAPTFETPSLELPANDGLDTDKDGLTDYVEVLLGTLPNDEDTDDDLISDGQEVEGFLYNNENWVTDPLEMDTNRDGISDGIEWTINASGDIPSDSDTDGVPDLFDNDNDGDGVPDKLDLSPNTAVDNTFDGDNPFSLVLNGLADDKITYVEFQLRPVITDHLQFTYNAFDWPDDRQGHIQDANGTIEDVRLIPMLEIIVPNTSKNLIPTDVLKQYNIISQDLPGDNQAVYVPLNLVRDPQGSQAVAFNGKMIYNSDSNWGAAHQVRLVWLVDMKNDTCAAFDSSGLCSSYDSYDTSQIIHTYEDSWNLTGLNVRENHWTDIATIYEDQSIDGVYPADETSLWQLSYGLDHSFMAGGVVTGTMGTRLWDIPEIAKRFDHTTNGSIDIEQRWNISNTLSVGTTSYSHLDEALMTTVQTTTLDILNTHFTSTVNNPISPTLVFARQDQYRSFNLDETTAKPDTATWGQMGEDANHLNLSISETAVPLEIASTLSWAPYLYDNLESTWKSYPLEQYWEYLGQKITPEMIAKYTDLEAAGGATAVAQVYYLSLANGLHNIVQVGEHRLEQDFWFADKPIGASVAKGLGVGTALIVEGVTDNLDTLKDIHRMFTQPLCYGCPKTFNPGELETFITKLRGLSRVGSGLALVAVVTVMIGIGIGAYFLLQEWQGDSEGTRIAIAVIVGAALAFLTVFLPLKQIKNLTSALQKTDGFQIGISKKAALNRASFSSESITKGAKIGAVIGLVISIGVIWGIFLYAVIDGGITPGSVAFNTLLAQTIAATILAIIQFVLAFSLVGSIIVAIFAIVDILLLILGIEFSINGWLTEQLGKALYHFELTVSSDIDTGSPELNLINPNRGMVAGVVMAVNMPITTTIKHKSPQDGWGWRVAPYLPVYYTESNLKSTTFAYSLTPEEDTFNVKRDKMRGQWDTTFDRNYALSPFYQGENVADPTTNVTLTTGINQPLSLHLNSSYALPGVECWTIPIPIWPWVAPVCIDKTIDGKNSSQVGASILLDVLPTTLDEFVAFNWGGNVPFPTQPDRDNDGLITRDLNGNDPNPELWDSDNDGLSDSYEITRRAAGVSFEPLEPDTDFDGLSDFDEVRFGTDPSRQDTDQDGLKDSVEVWHFDTISKTWTGGWDFTVTYITTDNVTIATDSFRIFSDPLQGDADGDGMSDGIEKALHLEDPQAYPFNPNAFNENPVALYLSHDDDDGFVEPNQSVTISATVSNNLTNPLFALGNYTLTLPAELGSGQFITDFNIFQGTTDSIVTTAVITSNSSGPIAINANSLARLHDGDLSWSYGWMAGTTTSATADPGNEFYFAQLTTNPDPTSSPYAVIALQAPEDNLPAPKAIYDDVDILANGEVSVAPAAGGAFGGFSPKQAPNDDVLHTTGKIGNSEPAIACNNQGQCAEAYVEVEWNSGCADVSFDSVKINVTAFYDLRIYDVSADTITKFWQANGTAGQALPIGTTMQMCTGDAVLAVIGGAVQIGTEFPTIAAPNQAVFSPTGEGTTEAINVTYTVLPTNARRYGAIRILDSNLSSLYNTSRILLEETDGGRKVMQTANPAIAVSDDSWLVGFETYGDPNDSTDLYTQLIINNAYGGEHAERLDNDDPFYTGVNDHNLALAWAGNQYLAVWESDTEGAYHDIKMAFINSGGFVTERRNVDVTPLSNERMPDIAYSATLNQSLLVYLSGNKVVGRLIQGNTVGDRFDIGNQISLLKDPNVLYDEINNAWIVSWLDVSNNGSKSYFVALVPSELNEAPTPLTSLHAIDTPLRHVLDVACQPVNANQLPINRNISQQANCVALTSSNHVGNSSIYLDNFHLVSTPPWIGEGTLESTATQFMVVDAVEPNVVEFTSFTQNETVAITDTFVFGGNASDETSYISLVEVKLPNEDWQPATGTESWSFAWDNIPNTDGLVTIQVRATDAVSLTTESAINIFLDRTPPTPTINQSANQFITATQDGNGRYHLNFSGTANVTDNDVARVEALISPSGSGWQTATVSSNSWTVDYILPEYDENSDPVINPTGNFTLTVRAKDSLDNIAYNSAVLLPFRLDATPPEAILLDYGPSRGVITDTITLSGVITDPGAVASGIQQLEIDFVPLGQITDTWQTATLANSGSGVANTTWSYAVPSGIEDNYLINLRGIDEQGNQSNQESWFSNWQGEIDTWAPRAEITATLLYTGTAAKTNIQATITDRNLTEVGLESLCNVTNADRVTETDVLPDGIDPGRERLVALNLNCQLPGHVNDPITLRVFDIFGHETTQTIIASPTGGAPAIAPQAAIQDGSLVSEPQAAIQDDSLVSEPLAVTKNAKLVSQSQTTAEDASLVSPSLDTVQMAAQIAPQQAPVAPTLLVGTVLTPTHDSVITDISAPITIDGGAYGINGLKAVTLTINSTFYYSATWAVSPVITDTLWQTTWTPPGDGVYELVTTVEDWSGGVQTDLYPVTVIVDTTPPAVTLATTVLTETHRLSFGRLELTGTVTDTQGVEAVTVSVDSGSAVAADVDGTTWRYVWTPLIDPDGSTYSAVVTAYDAGNETSITSNLVVDVVAPQMMTVTHGYTTGGTPVAINEGDTVRDPATTGLTMSWIDATDGSGIADYRVGWTNSPTPTLSALTPYANASTLHTTAVSEATLWFAHTAVFDTVGNRSIQTSGPIVVDAPTTPDYINPSDGLGGVYRGWMDSSCSLVGADYEVARYAPDGSSLNAVQKFYTTWDATHLRLAWTGADWRVDGDLFIYLDTTGGGATAAYNPYSGAGAAITLPDEGSGALGADYLIFIEDGSNANLLSWNGSDWVQSQPLTAPNFLFDPNGDVEKTDLYIPFNWIGSPTTLKLVALASEEDSLNLWAAMPDHNPLNSERAVNPAAITTLDLPFALTQHYEWSNVGQSGVCPATGQFQNADLHFELVAEPSGVSVGFLQHDLPGLTPPNSALDANLDGVIDAALSLDVDPVPVGRDAVISYTLHYANNGPADATNVLANITAAGGLKNLSANSLPLGTIAANSSGSVSFTAVVNPDVNGASAEIQLEIADAVHAPFDWLWQQHDIDSQGPTDVKILSPITYLNPYTNTLRGIATDVSGIPEITLLINGTTTQTCVDTTPNDGEWNCLWNANGAAQGTTFQFEAKGMDEWGNVGNYGPPVTLTVDAGFPDISLSQQTINSLADGFLTSIEAYGFKLSGSVSDSNEAGGAEICALADGETESTCVEVPVTPSDQTTANWVAEPPIPNTADGEIYTLSFTGVDGAGNRTPTPITYSVAADFAGPDIQTTNWPTIVSQFTRLDLTGTITDGSGVDRMSMSIRDPYGRYTYVDLGSDPNWSRNINFAYQGYYQFHLSGRDVFGNSAPYQNWIAIKVVAPNSNLPPTANTGGPYLVGEGQTVVLNGSMSDPNGGALTPSWDLDDDGIFEVTGVLSTTFDATIIDGPDQRTINMRVSDGQLSTTASTFVIISNQRPSADAGGPYTVAEGGQLIVSGSGVDIFAGDVLSYSWDLDNDGVFGDVLTATAVYDASNFDGTQFSTVSLQVTDDDGGATTATAPITITNIAPTLSNVAVTSIIENGLATLTGNMADASALDSFKLTVDWGDSSPITGYDYIAGTTTFSETHQYLDDNPSGTPTDAYTVTLTLTDDDDGTTVDTTTATVNNVAPTLSNLFITDITENGVATLAGTLGDVGSQDSFTMTVDWGDGTTVVTYTYAAGTTLFNETHQYLDDNPSGSSADNYTVNLTITDDDTGTSSNSITVKVTNLNPTLSNIAIIDVDENGEATLTGNLTDVGTQDSFTLDVDWGDGTAVSTYTYPTGTTTFTETHRFIDDNPSGTAADDYTVSLTLTDDDTGTDVDSTVVTVTNLDPTLSNIAITDVDENGVATLTGNLADVGTEDSFTLDVDWGDGTAVSTYTYTYPAGTTTFTETHQYIDDNPTNTSSDPYTVNLTLTDDDTGQTTDSVVVTVSNVDPVLVNIAITDVDEDGVATLTGNLSDVGTEDSFTLDVDWGDGTAVSTNTYTYPAGTTTFTETYRYLDDNPSGTAFDPYTVSLTLTDDDTGSTTDSVVVTVTNVAPDVSADVPTQTVQYSDGITDVTITGTDVAGDPLQASTSWNVNGGSFVNGLPAGMSLTTNNCSLVVNMRTCSWTLSGIAGVSAGTYTIRTTIDDDDLGQTSIDRTIVVEPEDAVLNFDADNPVAVLVNAPNSNASEPFSLVVTVEELEPDLAAYLAAAGDINLAQVSMVLEPVGPGGPVSGVCTPNPVNPVTGYDDVLTATCSFVDVPVNTYSVAFVVDGGYYTGYSEDVVVIYDPSLGFTTGGGWFYWPDSEDLSSGYPGDKTNFGYTMKYNKPLTNIQGNLLLIRHLPDGTIYRFKSNAIEGLSLGDVGAFGWASFTGKGTYLEPGWPDPIGNHQFIFYVEDHDEPGNGIDRVWVETRDKDDLVIPVMSMPRSGSDNAIEINGGNIVVPHTGGTFNPLPTAEFSFAVDGLTVNFTDQSSDQGGQIVSWQWDFGDGNSSAVENPSHSYSAAGTYDVTLIATDNDGATAEVTHQVAVNSGTTATEMHIGDLTASSAPSGNKWDATVTIQVLDDAGNPVANAQVSGSWSNGTSGSGSCLTDALGICTVTKTNIQGNRSSVTFTVGNVTHATLTYNASLNVETAIVVPK